MISLVQRLLENEVGLLFVIISIGMMLGSIRLGKFKMGGSGVLLAALVFGHFGHVLPKIIQTIGVVLFVYSVGLRAGPYIVQSLKKSKGSFVIISVLIVLTSGSLSILFRHLFGYAPELISGVYAGSMTSTPALAAAMEALQDSTPSVGYGLAYPIGILGVIFMVQILPIILKVDLKEEEKKYRAEFQTVTIERQCFRITNPNIVTLPIEESLSFSRNKFRIARIQRGEKIITPHGDQYLKLGDIVLVVGQPAAMREVQILFGELVDMDVPESEGAQSRWITVSSRAFVGRQLQGLEIGQLYGVIMTRVRREGIEFIPQANFTFEAGDEIRISGTADDLQRFAQLVSKNPETLHETDIFSFAFGLSLAVLVGLIKIPLFGGLSIGLGIAGGPLVVGLLFGYFGRFGRIMGHMPKAANLLVGDLGLYLFLAVAGCAAGEHFVQIFKENGILLILCGAALTIAPMIVATIVGRFILKLNLLVILGMICGGMTSTPALAVLTSDTKSDVPSLAYTSIYPLAVLLTTLMAQIIVLF